MSRADSFKGAPGPSRRIAAYLRVITQAMNAYAHAYTKVLHAWYEIQSSPRTRRQKTSSFSAAARDVGLNEDFNAVPRD